MGVPQCCVASGEANRNDETELLALARMPSQEPISMRQLTVVPDHSYMDRIVNDASRRVRELKR